jgi:hypothetical protein
VLAWLEIVGKSYYDSPKFWAQADGFRIYKAKYADEKEEKGEKEERTGRSANKSNDKKSRDKSRTRSLFSRKKAS